jgi:alginate O-acetyltransferase complex protein AlgI
MALTADSIWNNGAAGNTWDIALAGSIAYTLQIYFDFSGYSDMAIGLGRMFGFHFNENFDLPYTSKSITEFWRRWHISLGTWFREYVYIPLGGNRKGMARQMLNLLIVWFLTGFWHGADFNFIFWGLYFGLLLVLEKFVLKKWLDKDPAVIQHIYALFFIILGWVLFYFSDLSEMGAFFTSMFSFGGTAITADAGALALSYLPMLLVAAFASTPVMTKLYRKIENTKADPALKTAFCIAVLGIATALLVSQSYNPFLYFRF